MTNDQLGRARRWRTWWKPSLSARPRKAASRYAALKDVDYIIAPGDRLSAVEYKRETALLIERAR